MTQAFNYCTKLISLQVYCEALAPWMGEQVPPTSVFKPLDCFVANAPRNDRQVQSIFVQKYPNYIHVRGRNLPGGCKQLPNLHKSNQPLLAIFAKNALH
jgi:hypothetical protein